MVLAIYAIGYNLLFGYTGLLSLGHAMFFAAGMYGYGLTAQLAGWPALPAFALGILAGAALGLVVGALALRTAGVAFMIVTLMFAQSAYLTILYFGTWTRGDEGFVVPGVARVVLGIDLSGETERFVAALILFSLVLLVSGRLVRSRLGRTLVAIRENEERTRMLGYDATRLKLIAITVSAALSGLAGAAYALLFGYVGASFAAVPYSIFPLLWVLLGGAGTTVGPLIGVFFMFYLIDTASGITLAYMLIAGLALVLLTLFAPQGIAGLVRRRVRWLP
ncbi:branched-chain amino acid ABC transporter permease [Jannaschia formosa]|nr:branched-chain amino acid ABC transporter permease [Jannaschia formosa]